MDILTIATREANAAADRAQTPESQYDAYRTTYDETIDRGRKAEELLAAGAVRHNGTGYIVESQNDDSTYHVNLAGRSCDCPDHAHRGVLCKHLQAAALYDAQDPGLGDANGDQVVLEVGCYVRGRQLLDKKVKRVRVNGGSYRKAKNSDYEAALEWLRAAGYELAGKTGPGHTMGTGTVRYIYQKPANHDDALPIDRPRRRDRLFKTAILRVVRPGGLR